jgi:hypothetical protein
MKLEDLAGMFSNKTGVQQSIGSTIMSTVMSYAMQNLMQRGIGSFMNSGGKDRGPMKSALSQLQGDTSNNTSHELVQQVKNSSGIKDDQQAKQYTQQALNVLQEHTDNNPQEVHSVLQSHANDKGFDLGSLLRGFT